MAGHPEDVLQELFSGQGTIRDSSGHPSTAAAATPRRLYESPQSNSVALSPNDVNENYRPAHHDATHLGRRAMSHHDTLTPEQAEAAWKLNFRLSIDGNPDSEVAWEARTWRALGADLAAEVADEVLAERRAHGISIPGGADAADLDLLITRVELQPALRLCRDEAQSLIAAIRLVYWSGLRETPR